MSVEQRRITLTEEDEWWVATDESVGEHGVTSQGRTREEALENLDEAVELTREALEADTPAPVPDAPWFDDDADAE